MPEVLNQRELIAQVRRIEIRTRHVVDDLVGGAYHSVFKGRGMEFNEVREYIDGDEVRTIDWNVTARLGHPYVKKFVEERELTVNLLVDISGSGDAGGVRRRNEQAAELAAVLALSATRNNDRVGLLLFTDLDELHLPPKKGRRHVLRLVRDLLACERRRRGTDLRLALEHLCRSNRRRSITFLISDFQDDGYDAALRLASRQHDLVAIRLTDRAEAQLPAAGWLTVEDAETGATASFSSAGAGARSAYASGVAAQRAATEASCRQAGVDLIDIRTGEDYVQPLMRFFRTRERRRAGGR